MTNLRDLTEEARNHIIDREENALLTYLNENLFECQRNESVLDTFNGLERLLSTNTGTKGDGVLSAENYSLTTGDILKEVEIFSGLISDIFTPSLVASYGNFVTTDYVSKLVLQYIFNQVNFIFDEKEFEDVLAYELFLELPRILNVRTKREPSGLIGLITCLISRENDPSEFKPFLTEPIGKSIYNLKKRAIYLKEKGQEIRRTKSECLRGFLLNKNPDFIKFGKFKEDERVSGLIEKLDTVWESLSSISQENNSDKQMVTEFINFIDTLYFYHSTLKYSAFTRLIENVNSALEKSSQFDLSELIENLKESLQYNPEYVSQISSGNSPVKRFDNPQIVTDILLRGINSNDKKGTKEHS